jgi:DNA-directed RNA polymerase subunit RPC12/RpoP
LLMATGFERDREGNEYEFYLAEGRCLKCGAPCTLEIGQNETSSNRIDCPFCGYREGYGEGDRSG